MGRAMLIILSGVIVAMGYMGIGATEKAQQITTKNVDYAEFVKAKNAAHTAIQISMQKMNEDSTWGDTHHSGNSWTATIDGTPTELYVEYIYDGTGFWIPDTLRLVSKASYLDNEEVKVINVYIKNPFAFVPQFKSALTIATTNYTLSGGGSASISGIDPNGGQCSDMPAVTTMNSTEAAYAESQLSSIPVDGSTTVDPDTTLSYQPTDLLIARLEDMAGTQHITGSYKGDMGTETNPGVFFVEEGAKLTGGITDGYGILVVRSNGSLSYEEDGVELDIAGNFTFNGLVIFENAYNLDGSGTPTINGSVLIGNSPDSNQTIDIDITGNLHLQYDCVGQDYANKAAALTIKQNQYQRISTFE